MQTILLLMCRLSTAPRICTLQYHMSIIEEQDGWQYSGTYYCKRIIQ